MQSGLFCAITISNILKIAGMISQFNSLNKLQMMKNFKLSLPLMLLLTCCFIALSTKGLSKQHLITQDTLSVYTGKYEMKQGCKLFMQMYILKKEN